MISPSIFIGHGSPMNAVLINRYHNDLRSFANSIDYPKSIVVVSAHWERQIPLQITSSSNPKIIYDYYGFPDKMYNIKYNPPGNPKLAVELSEKLNNFGLVTQLNPRQGLDHGAWIPSRILFPEANVPIVQISIPILRKAEDLIKIGASLREFRKNGVMFMGSGNLVHNLPHVFNQVRKGKVDFNEMDKAKVEPWAREIDSWLKENLDELKIDKILQIREELDNFDMAAPTTEHFDPLYFVLGTREENETINYFHEGFEGGSISMRTFTIEN
jgi:4,5-DOPA dioxygenase extradiol